MAQLSAKQRNEPHHESEHDAYQDARDDGEVERAPLALYGDIAGQAAEPKWQPPANEKEATDGGQNQPAKDKPLTEFTSGIHFPLERDRLRVA
jgi:hypothetical protein